MFLAFAFISGLIFGIGLLVSQMANPSKVLGFLDVSGRWDPSLFFVMLGALMVSIIAFRIAKHLKKAVCAETIQIPKKGRVDFKLIIGSILFGAGWGLAGFCPGPAIVGTGALIPQAALFTASMLVGMGIVNLTNT